MCGRYELHTPVEDLARRFDAALTDEAAALPPRYNIAPTLRVPVVRAVERGRRIEAMTWGLLPSWAKDAVRVRPINARVETVFEKPMFRNAIKRRRCLVPADGFYEWRAEPAGKQPFHIGMVDGASFAFGGIWEYWAKPEHEPVVSCAILVTAANELMAKIHDRMPVIVRPEHYAGWLDPTLSDPRALAPMLEQFPAEEMRAYPVSKRVNSARNEGADLVQPLDRGG
jgi:putative SOS response-associated peptidase YedK